MNELLPILPEAWRVNLVLVTSMVGVLRLFIKPVGNLIKSRIVSAMETASNSIDPEDDTWIEAMLRSRTYKIFAFVLDWLASVKLPSAGELHHTVTPTPRNP